MRGFTVDVGILMSGSELGAPEHHDDCRSFMEALADVASQAELIWDSEGMISYQYENSLRNSEYGQAWIRRMTDLNRIRPVKRAMIPKPVRIELLDKLHFDPEDFNYYVRTAAAEDAKLLVAHDDDYSAEVCRVLKKRLLIRVCDSSDGTRLCWEEGTEGRRSNE